MGKREDDAKLVENILSLILSGDKGERESGWKKSRDLGGPRNADEFNKRIDELPPGFDRDPRYGGNDSGCFITTAVCQTLRKPDDCAELTKFRCFRDTFMQDSAEMRAEVQEYYDIAPKICAAIDATGKKAAADRYASIWETFLKPAFAALDKDDNFVAHDLYRSMVIGLKKEFIGD